MPKWSTPIRQAHLVRLWAEFGNKCLEGHSVCPNPSHYIYRKAKAVSVAKPITLPCVNSEGEPIRDRQGNQLYITLYRVSTGICYEERVSRLYDLKCEEIIETWKAEDRAQRGAERKAEQRLIHSLGERRYPLRGQFSNIAQDIFFAEQPQHYLEGLGISGLTFKPFAKVRIASSYMRLFVELGDSLKGVSKAKKRKAIRYGKALPVEVQKRIELACSLAVSHYLNNR